MKSIAQPWVVMAVATLFVSCATSPPVEEQAKAGPDTETHAVADEPAPDVARVPEPARAAPAVDHEGLAKVILAATGLAGGLIVHVGCGDGKLTAALAASEGFLVQGFDSNAANVAAARALLTERGLNGTRAAVDVMADGALPLVDNLANLVVCESADLLAKEEALRVLAPRGIAYVKDGDTWHATFKRRPPGMDEWPQYLRDASNNAVSKDELVGPPRHVQWIGSPRWARHHDNMASMSALVSSGGRIFYIFDEGPTWAIALPPSWRLIARDAFNGTVLWKREIETWHSHLWPLKSGPAQLPRRLAAAKGVVYVTLGIDAPVSALDARTGATLRTFDVTKGAEELVLDGGTLFAMVDSKPPARAYADFGAVRKAARSPFWDERPRGIVALNVDTGATLWRAESRIMPLTLSADAARVVYHDGEKVVCLDRASGEVRWSSEPVARAKSVFSFFAPTLVLYDGVVLFAGGSVAGMQIARPDTKIDEVVAYTAETGEELWRAPHPASGYRSPEDVLVAKGVVWWGETTSGGLKGVFTGRDVRTGKVVKAFPPDVETYWFHHRCHRGKATEKYLMMSRTGIEFIDPEKESWDINHWIRGGCLYGIMPANGLVYCPPHDCACYLDAKQCGFNAVAGASDARRVPERVDDEARLEKGEAYDVEIKSAPPSDAEWPTYRGDGERSGRARLAVGADLKRAWRTSLGGRLTPLVVAGGTVFVAQVDRHTLHALDAATGEARWRFTTGGRIDSPPTVLRGRAYFGSHDGYVYCLTASDGKLAWRFRAAPVDRRLTAYEQVESVWPVHGSVLIHDDKVHCIAGRSVFLDGGLRMIKLSPVSGKLIAEKVLDEKTPDGEANLQVHVKGLNMPAALPDILSTDGKYLYMRNQPLDMDFNRVRVAPHSGNPNEQGSQQGGERTHLFCPTGFLDGTWFHRTYWLYACTFASGWNGYYVAGKYAPAGRILAFDAQRVYGFGRKPQYYRWTTALEYQLFSTSKEAPKVEGPPPSTARGTMVRFDRSPSLNPANTPVSVEAWVKPGRGGGVIIARGGNVHGWSLLVDKGKAAFAVRAANAVATARGRAKLPGGWVHLAGVLRDASKLEVYVNGKLAGEAKAPGFIPTDPHQSMEIGADDGSAVGEYKSPFGFTGSIDEVRVYRGALSPDEIAAHAADPSKADAAATLVLRCPLDGDAADVSGNGNDGRVAGAQAAGGKAGRAMNFFGSRRPAVRHHLTYAWTVDVPMLVRALVLADGTLFIAGPPDVVDENEALKLLADGDMTKRRDEQVAAFAGGRGGALWAVSTSDGAKTAAAELASPPVWDGMAGAYGKLYMATMDGSVECFE